MITCCAYTSDDNDLIKLVQHESYFRHAAELFNAARRALVRADSIICADLLVARKARAVDRFDHRVLQEAHDILAAAFRYQFDEGSQLRLFEGEQDFKDRYRRTWLDWFATELKNLSELPPFVRSVVQSVLLANTELEHASTRELNNFLITHYAINDLRALYGYAA